MRKVIIFSVMFAALFFSIDASAQNKLQKSQMTQAEIDAAIQARTDATQLRSTTSASNKKVASHSVNSISDFGRLDSNRAPIGPSAAEILVTYQDALDAAVQIKSNLVGQQQTETTGTAKWQELANKITLADTKITYYTSLINGN